MFDVGQKTWKSYDWSQITTVATFGKYDSELMCYAHSKGARVVLKGMLFPDLCVQQLGNFICITCYSPDVPKNSFYVYVFLLGSYN